jgi:Zn-dependent protease with chaperone function
MLHRGFCILPVLEPSMAIRSLRRLRFAALLLALLFATGHSGRAQTAAPAGQSAASASQPKPTQSAYSLPPDKLAKAITLTRIRTEIGFADTGWGIVSLLLLIVLGVPAKFRDWAVAASRFRWVQCLIFVPLFFLTSTIVGLPIDLYSHHIERAYGQSVQGWPSWTGDQVKSLLLSFVIGVLIVMLLFWVIRKSPKRWWLWFWLATLPIIVFLIFISPVLIDPMFNKFEPLQQSDPALVARLEKVVHRGGMQIPPERMFLMKASEKYTGINAYVTGFGASKRVVVWDTSIAQATPDEISFIFGHEMGHYVLGHIYKTLVFIAGVLLVMLWLGYYVVHWLIRRFGAAWKVPSVDDWAALAILLLAFSVFSFLSEPVLNAYSRAHEHAADVYGQEAIHGIVANPQQVARDSFQLLGEASLDDPNPRPFIEFWTYSHPSVAYRVAFAASYNPWAPGQKPKYFPPEK